MSLVNRAAYERDGIVFPLKVLWQEEVSRFRDGLEDLEARLRGKPKAVEMGQSHLHFRWAYDLATHLSIDSPSRGRTGRFSSE